MPLAVDRTTLDALVDLARQAGDVVMSVYAQDFDVMHKGDQSPVTVADERAEAVIVAGLRALDASIPIVAEESMAKGQRPAALGTRFWLVDPLDGTKEFIRRNGEFTVNIALIENGAPVMGVVYAPALGRMYAGAAGLGAYRWLDNAQKTEAIAVRRADTSALVAVASKSHRTPETDAYLNRLPVTDSRSAGSSLKFCLVAEGSADIYPRFGPTCEWDTAAGDAVLRAAGGAVLDFSGAPLRYGKPDFLNPHFLAHGQVDDVAPYLN
jgi:3'(2'), 5'-bisphosphate nucleotidase